MDRDRELRMETIEDLAELAALVDKDGDDAP